MRRSRIRDPTWQSIASVVDPLFRLAMLFTPAGPIPPRLTSLAAAWIPCIKQFWLHRKMRVREANAAIGESREQCCPEPAGNPNPARCKRAQCIPCASSATQIRPTSRWQRAPRDCAGPADLPGRMSGWRLDSLLFSVNAGEKLLRRAGVKMHHGLRRRAGLVQVSDVQTQLSCSIDEPAFPSRPASPEPRRAT